MHYIVCPVRPQAEVQHDGSAVVSDKVARDALRVYRTDEEQAKQAARDLAAKHPGVQFGVFKPVDIFECMPPPPPKVIQKVVNDRGEITMAQEGA